MGEQPPAICDYDGSDYQERFWERGGRAYEDRSEAGALARLLPAGEGPLLEVGAGAGRNSSRYEGYRPVVLLDYSRSQLRQAQERLGGDPRFVFVAADVYRLPFAPGSFRAATMIRVIHHLTHPLASLEQVRRVLAPGSAFVLEYANKRNLKAVLRWLLRRQRWNPFDDEAIEFAALNFNFHPSAVRKWLRQAGFRVTRQRTVSHFRLETLKRVVPLRLLVALDRLMQPTGRLFQLTPSVFVRADAVGERAGTPGEVR